MEKSAGRKLEAAARMDQNFSGGLLAGNFFDGFDGTGGPNAAYWQVSNWSNGSPFGCTFAYSEAWLSGSSNLVWMAQPCPA